MLGKLDVQETKVDVAKRAVDIGKVSLTGGEVNAWLSAQGQLNLLELATPAGKSASGSTASTAAATSGSASTAAASPDAPVTAAPRPSGPAQASASTAAGTPASASTPAPAWTVSVPDITVDGFKVSAEDRQVTPALALVLDPINIHVAGYNTAPDAHLDITARNDDQQQRHFQCDGATFSRRR